MALSGASGRLAIARILYVLLEPTTLAISRKIYTSQKMLRVCSTRKNNHYKKSPQSWHIFSATITNPEFLYTKTNHKKSSQSCHIFSAIITNITVYYITFITSISFTKTTFILWGVNYFTTSAFSLII